ncbi:MAG: hypothetical protein HY456_02955 [Parcubacteria group bacterium]|nr:hypothetical protein [Parcubacteria group bacterium]
MIIVMIRKVKGKYVVLSETTRRRMGSYRTLKEAKRRLAQVEYFKHLKHSPRLRRQVRKRSLLRKVVTTKAKF